MTSTCGLRMAFERAARQLGARLPPGHVERRDDEVEGGEQVVLEVERAVGADLQLAAVEQAEAVGRRAGGAVPAASSAAKRALSVGDDLALLRDLVGREAAGDGQRLGVVGQDLVGVAAPSGGLGHLLDRVDAVGPVGVRVQVAAQVVERR